MVSTHVYVPSDLYDWLRDGAKRDRRSVNQHVLYLLDRIRDAEQQSHTRPLRCAEGDAGYAP